MADAPRPVPGEEVATLSLFEDEAPAPEDGDAEEPPSPEPAFPGGIRETILRFLDQEL
jgi:hypothetical protein